MDTIFMNSENSKRCDFYRLRLNLSDKTEFKRSFSYVALSNLSMMNCFSGTVDRRKAFSLIFIWDPQRSSPSRISNTPRAGLQAAQNLSSDLVE